MSERGIYDPLSEREIKFVNAYLYDSSDLLRCYELAGYSTRHAGAKSNAQAVFRRPRVQRAIKEERARIHKGTTLQDVTPDWVIQKLVQNVNRSMQAEPVLDEEGNPTGIYRYAGNVANKALELLGKHLGMFIDRSEIKLDQQVKLEQTVTLEDLNLPIEACKSILDSLKARQQLGYVEVIEHEESPGKPAPERG